MPTKLFTYLPEWRSTGLFGMMGEEGGREGQGNQCLGGAGDKKCDGGGRTGDKKR